MENEQMYPHTAKEARERGELEQWRANYRANCACAGAIELVIRESFDGMHLEEDCARRVIGHSGYKRTAFVLANTLQEHSYDGRYHPTNIQWSRSIYIPPDGDHRYAFMVGSHPAVLDGFIQQTRQLVQERELQLNKVCLQDKLHLAKLPAQPKKSRAAAQER
mgnify:FL=1